MNKKHKCEFPKIFSKFMTEIPEVVVIMLATPSNIERMHRAFHVANDKELREQ